MKSEKKKPRCIWLVIAAVVVGLILLKAAFFFATWNEWGLRKALPRTAEDVHEWAWEDGFLPDYSYMLKARISEQEFKEYVEYFGLTPHSPDRQYSEDDHNLSWRPCGLFDEDWWDVSDTLDANTFVSEGQTTWTYAKYENGYIYVKSLDH